MVILKELSGDLIFSRKVLEGDAENVTQKLSGSIINNGTRSSPTYQGIYEVTPSSQTQVLSTRDMRMEQNVTINPIPNNYGLITWDGSTITVS